jgi:hypothetical protein
MPVITDERGAVAVFVAVCMTVLLGMGALVLDVGQLYVERLEVQNGADAAALAIAEDCARGLTACDDFATTADELADDNAGDGLANIDDVDLDLKKRTIAVTTSTATKDGDEIEFGFARVLGFSGRTVTAHAEATWGIPRHVDAFPVTISTSEYEAGQHVVLCFKQNTSPSCADGYGGAMDGPGSFGYVDALGCVALNHQGKPLDVGDKAVDVDHGNDGPKNLGCVAAKDLEPDPATPTKLHTIFLPVHDKLVGGQYSIVGYAAIEVDAFKFTGNPDEWCWSYETPITCGGNGRWLSGTFVDFVVQGVPMVPKGTGYAGVAVIELTK